MHERRQAPPRAKKSLGQNFLVDQNVCRKIVASLGPLSGRGVLEIGPGRGALTGLLIEGGPDRYLAIEKDADLAERLRADHPTAEVLCQDALAFDWGKGLATEVSWLVCGNLPYNVGSKIVWDFAHKARGWSRAVFMLQQEVALRIAAAPGSRQYGALTAWLGNFVQTEYLFKVPPTVFRPRPKVDSAVFCFTPLGSRPEDTNSLARVIHLCFQKRRKQLRTILKNQWNEHVEAFLAESGHAPDVRPERLSPAEFARLATLVKPHFP